MDGAGRVLAVIHETEHGGGPIFVRTLLDAVGPPTTWALASAGGGWVWTDLGRRGVERFRISIGLKRSLAIGARQLRDVITCWQPDVVLAFGQFAGAASALALTGKRARPRFVYSAQFPSFYTDFDRLRTARNWLAERFTAGAADALIALNDDDADEFCTRGLSDPAKITVIPNAVDVTEFAPADEVRSNGFVVGFVGRLDDLKGVDTLIDAVAILEDRARGSVSCRVIGDGERRRALERRAAGLRERGVIEFSGQQVIDSSAYHSFDVLAVPSEREPFGIVALEAMASGTPVVASAVGGLKMSVVDGETGYLVLPGDPVALADRLDRLRRDPELRLRFGTAGAARARACFDAPRIAAMYSEVLAGGAQWTT